MILGKWKLNFNLRNVDLVWTQVALGMLIIPNQKQKNTLVETFSDSLAFWRQKME